jgi:hypothetical protein
MSTWRTTIRATIGGGATLLLLAGCGGGEGSSGGGGSDFADESGDTITTEAEKDMKALSAVSMKGDLTNAGQKLSIDMSLTTDGDCTGSIGFAEAGTAQIIALDKQSWMKADTQFWTTTAGIPEAQVEQLIGDKWVVLPESAGFSEVCDLDSLLEDLGQDDDGKKVDVGETETVDGQEAVVLSSETDEGDPLKAWVATDDPHYILKMEVTQGKEPGTISFSDFDEDLDVQAPAGNEVVDLEKMGG